nr:DUF2513 domain-containing protein [Bradyrhizobium sp. BR 10289]
MKRLLEACQASEKPTFDIRDLDALGFDRSDDRFEFHLKILADQRLIEQDDGEPGFGLQKSIDGFRSWNVVPLRLTAAGHDFIEALSNKEVWAAIKSGFKDASLSTLKSVSLKLLEGYVKKKVDDVLK